jgi:predicted Zn-dependent protease
MQQNRLNYFPAPGRARMSILGFFFVAAWTAGVGCPGRTKKGADHAKTQKARTGAEKAAAPEIDYVEKTFETRLGKKPPAGAKAGPILGFLEAELKRNIQKLKAPDSPKPYHLAYTVDDIEAVTIRAELGSISRSRRNRSRQLTVDMRVGTRKFDNTHFLERSWGAHGGSLPIEDDEAAIRTEVWLATDRIYRSTVEEYARVKAKFKTSSKEKDESNDFSPPVRLIRIVKPARLKINVADWEERLRKVSKAFRQHPELMDSWVQLSAHARTRYYISNEGSKLQVPTVRFQITLGARVMADDGMRFQRHEFAFAEAAAGLPEVETLVKMAHKVTRDLEALRTAPLADPYEGPAIFEGKAAAVFFHEVFGHRMEGHRQKLRRFDQTFTKKIGQQVMPDFLSIFDDPRLYAINGHYLNGHYFVDDEAVEAQRVDLVKNGVLKDFLMSRTPIKTHPQSNGHGRRSAGRTVVARQGNLVIDADRVVAYATLRKMLLEEVKKQNKPYGLMFREVTGGFTFTHRRLPQAYKIKPVLVYRIYPDGRRDKLVRGVDMVGTPLLALTRIMAAANDFQTFNGMCGAESGWVPVSATAPSLLLKKIETQRKPNRGNKPPILPPPTASEKKEVRP